MSDLHVLIYIRMRTRALVDAHTGRVIVLQHEGIKKRRQGMMLTVSHNILPTEVCPCKTKTISGLRC